MCIERNRNVLFWTARGLQIVLPNPTTPALTCEVGLVHQRITRGFSGLRAVPYTSSAVTNRQSGPVIARHPAPLRIRYSTAMPQLPRAKRRCGQSGGGTRRSIDSTVCSDSATPNPPNPIRFAASAEAERVRPANARGDDTPLELRKSCSRQPQLRWRPPSERPPRLP